MYTVYMHENKTNRKRYVGITSKDVKVRWKRGFGYSEHLPMGRAFRKYGWDGFSHQILFENLEEQEAKRIEKELISEWKTQDGAFGYNICSGGDGVTGWHPTEETRKKISESAKRRTGANNPNFGHRWTDEMRAKASQAKRRENLSEETLRRMSESSQGRAGSKNPFYGKTHSDETKQILAEYRFRSVRMFDKDGSFLKEFRSIKEAAEYIGRSGTAISNCCSGKAQTSGGYKWKYSDKCDL